MINREIIRLKGCSDYLCLLPKWGEEHRYGGKRAFFSLAKAYDLYNYLLTLMVEINRIAERAVETAQSRYNRIKVGEPPSTKFIDNRFIMQLEVNKQLLDFRENQKKSWVNEEDFCAFVVQANYRDGLLQRIYGVGRVFFMHRTGSYGARYIRMSFVIMKSWTLCLKT